MSSYLSLIPIDKNLNNKSIISTNQPKQLKYFNKFSISPRKEDINNDIPSFSKNIHNTSFQKFSIESKKIPCLKTSITPTKSVIPQIVINYVPTQINGNNMINSVNNSFNNASFLSNINNNNFTTTKKLNKYNFFSNNKKLRKHNISKGNIKNKFFDSLSKNREQNEQDYYSTLCGKDFVNELDYDSLNIIQENLQNKLYNMGMGSDFIEFETSPLEISISKLKIRKNKIISSQNTPNKNQNSLLKLRSKKNNNKETHTISQFNKNSKYLRLNTVSNKHKNLESFLLNEEDTKSYDKNILPSQDDVKNEDNKKEINIKSSDKNITKEAKAEKNQNSKNKLCEYKDKFRNFEHKKLVYDSLDDEEIIENVIEETFYISPDNKYIFVFDSLVFLSSLYIFIISPIDLILNRCNNSYWKVINNTSIDFLFIIDFILSFFRAYHNSEEQLVIESDKILENYLTSYFISDIISTIPFYSIFHFYTDNYYICTKNFITINEQYYKIFNLLKIFKFIKCCNKNENMFVKYCLLYLNEFSFFEKWSFLIGCIILFMLILHITACIHIFISTFAYPNWVTQQNLQYSSFIKIYTYSIYFLIVTITSVGYGDITGNSLIEFGFQIFLLIVGIISYSWLISYLSSYVKEKNKFNEIFYKKVNRLKEIKCEYPEMSKELYDKIFLHLEYTNSGQKENINSLMDSLPNSTQRILLFEMYKLIIENFNFFKNFHNSEFIYRVISKLTPTLAHKNDLLIEQGEIIENTIFVKQGKLSIEVKIDANNPERSIEKLLNEEYFLSVENNNIIQSKSLQQNNNINNTNITNGNSFSLLSLSTMHNKSLLNPKNIYDLYAGKDKNNLKHSVSITEIQAHPNLNIKYIHLKILDIRKNEHFGALLMFLNQRSPISLRVKTKKAELYILKKIDAVEISTCYPNIWKRVNKKSFHNLKQMKIKMKEIIIHFCDSYGICKLSNFKTSNKKNKIMNKSFMKSKSTIIKLNKNEFDSTFKRQKTKSKSLKEFSSKAALPEIKLNKDIIKENVLKQYFDSPRKKNASKMSNIKKTVSNKNNLNKTRFAISKDNIKNSNEVSKIENMEKDSESQIFDKCSISTIKSIKKSNCLQKNRPYYIRKFGDDNLYIINNFDLKSITNKNNSILLYSIDDLSKTIEMNDNEPRLILNQIINNRNNTNIRAHLPQLNNRYENKNVEMNNDIFEYCGESYYSKNINDEIYNEDKNSKLLNIENKKKQHNENGYISENNSFLNKKKILLSDPVRLVEDKYKNNNNINNSASQPTIKLKNKIFYINIFNCSKNNFRSKTFSNKNYQNKLNVSHFSLNYNSHLQNNKNNMKNIQENNNKKIEFSIFRTSLELLSESKAFVELVEKKLDINNKNKKNKSGFFYMKKSNTALGKCRSISDFSSYSENDDAKSCNKSISRSKSCNKNSKNEAKIINNRSKTMKNSVKNKIEYKSSTFINSIPYYKDSFIDKLLFNDVSKISAFENDSDGNKLKLSKTNFSMKIKSAYKNLNKLSNYQYIKDKDYQKIIKHMIKKRYKKENKFKESIIKNNVMKFSTYNKNSGLNDNLSVLKKNESKRIQRGKSIKDNDDNRKLLTSKNANNLKQRSKSFKNKNDEIVLANKNLKKDTAVLKNPVKFYSGFFNDLMKKGLLSSSKINNIKNVNKVNQK